MRSVHLFSVVVCLVTIYSAGCCLAVSDLQPWPVEPAEVVDEVAPGPVNIVDIREDTEARANVELASILIRAKYLATSGKVEEARELYRDAIKRFPGCAYAYYELASLLLGAEQLDSRIEYLEKAIELDPGMRVAYVSLGISYQIKKETEKTIETYRRAIGNVEDDLPFYTSLANTYLGLDREKEAEDVLEEACKKHSDSPLAWFRLIEFHINRGRIEAAEKAFERGLQATGNSLSLLRDVRGLYLRWKRYGDKALAILVRTLELYPESPSMWIQLVREYVSRGEKDKARDAAEKAISHLRYDEKFLTSLADVYINARDWDPAVFVLNEATKYHGRSVEIWRTLASLHNQKGDREKARDCYRRILSMEPTRTQERRLLALSYVAEKDYENAIKGFLEAIERSPQDLRLKVDLANAYLASGQFQKGEKVYLDLVKASPNKSEIYLLLATYYLKSDKPDQMGEIIDRAVELEKDPAKQARIFLLMGQAAMETEHKSLGISLLKAATQRQPDNPSHAYALGRAYLLLGDREGAVEHLRKAADLAKPSNPEWLLTLAETYRALGKENQAAESFAKAIVILEQSCEKAPQDLRARYELGLAHERAEDLPQAAEAYEKCVQIEPQSGDLKYKLASVYSELHWHEKARRQLEEAAELPSGKPEWFLLLGEVYRTLAKRTEAAQAFEKAVSMLQAERDKRPEDYRVWAVLGEAHTRARQFREANEVLGKAVQLAGDEADFRLHVAFARALGGDGQNEAARLQYLEAVSSLEKAVETDPKDADTHLRLGLILQNVYEYARSAEALSKGIELAGGSASYSSYVALADALEKSGDAEKSQEQFRKARSILTDRIKEHPEDVSAYYMLANVSEKLGDLDECERQYKKVMELDPYFAAAYNNLGYTWIENDMNIQQAMEYVRKALELEPDSGAYIDSLGWGYFKQGKIDEALAELLRALKYESTDPTVFDHIGDVYKAKKMIREAVEYWEKALDMNPNNQKIRKKIEQHQDALPPIQKKDRPEDSE